MENQHRKIKGYRDLSQEEIDLMNRIKEHGEKTKHLLQELNEMRCNQVVVRGSEEARQIGESLRCLEFAKGNLQTGFMWFVRAVALPESF